MSEESSSFVAPAGLLERVRNINQIYKQTVRLLPAQQGAVVNENKSYYRFSLILYLIYVHYRLMH